MGANIHMEKRSKAKFVIIGVVLVIAVIAVTGYLARGEILKMFNPGAYLAMAASNTAKELDLGSSGNAYYDMLRNIYAGSYSQTVSADLTNLTVPDTALPDYVVKAGVAISTDVDRANKKSSVGIKLRTGGAALLTANLFVGNSSLALQIPELYDSFLSVPTANFADKWNKSAVGGMTSKISEDIDVSNAFDMIYGADEPAAAAAANPLPGDLIAIFSKYYTKAEIKNSGKQAVDLPAGNEAKQSLITVSLTQTDFKNMIKDASYTIIDDGNNDTLKRLQEQSGGVLDAESVKKNITDTLDKISFSDPVVFNVFCDGRNRIVGLSFNTTIINADTAGEGSGLSAGISINNGQKLGDIAQIESKVKNSEVSYRMLISSDKSASKGQYYENSLNITIDDTNKNSRTFNCNIKTTYDGAAGSDNFKFSGAADTGNNDFTVSIDAAGNVVKDDNARSFNADFSNLTCKASQNGKAFSVSVKGGYSLAAKKEDVTDPANTEDLLLMDEIKLYAIMQQIYVKVSNIPAFSEIFGSLSA